MFDDTVGEDTGGGLRSRSQGIIGLIHHNGNAGGHGIHGDVVSHSAGAAGKDEFDLVLKTFEGQAQGVYGETLLNEGAAVKDLRHSIPNVTRRSGDRTGTVGPGALDSFERPVASDRVFGGP